MAQSSGAAIRELEGRTPSLKKSVKALIKAIEELVEVKRPNCNSLVAAVQEFGTLPASTHLTNLLRLQEHKEAAFCKNISDLHPESTATPLRK